ncbi:MAG: Rha family transcriptional regulator [Prevotella sp.]
MNDLVFIGQNDRVLTTSLKVAEIFGKEHSKVMRDITNLYCSDDFRAANFGGSSYTSEQNRQFPMYEMTKDGFTFLVMGYTGKKAAAFKEAYIKQFNEMEAELRKKQNPTELLMASAKAYLDQRDRIDEIDRRDRKHGLMIDSLWSELLDMIASVEYLKQKISNDTNYFTVAGYCSYRGIRITSQGASRIGRRASKMCKNRNLPIETLADKRYGKVNAYPYEVLKEIVRA